MLNNLVNIKHFLCISLILQKYIYNKVSAHARKLTKYWVFKPLMGVKVLKEYRN